MEGSPGEQWHGQPMGLERGSRLFEQKDFWILDTVWIICPRGRGRMIPCGYPHPCLDVVVDLSGRVRGIPGYLRHSLGMVHDLLPCGNTKLIFTPFGY